MRNIIFAQIIILAGCVVKTDKFPGDDFVGVQYMESPLGEAVAPDSDPQIRFDAFDCTTFVETVLADGNLEKLNKIRYMDGQVGFLTRNHFIESDWLQNNSDVVVNASRKYAPVKIRTVNIDKSNWFKVVHNLNTDFAVQKINMEYIPYENVHKIVVKEPVIVLFITDNQKMHDTIGTDLGVVHMGFLMPNGMLRHASSKYGRVVDVDFDEYITQRMKNKNNLGISVVEIK